MGLDERRRARHAGRSGSCLAAFLWRCSHHRAPVVELSLLRVPAFAGLERRRCCSSAIGFGAMLLLSVLFLTGEWDYTTLRAGLAIAPGPATVALLSLASGPLVVRFGARPVGARGLPPSRRRRGVVVDPARRRARVLPRVPARACSSAASASA